MNTKEFTLSTIKEKREMLLNNINLYNELTEGLTEDYFPDGFYISDNVLSLVAGR